MEAGHTNITVLGNGLKVASHFVPTPKKKGKIPETNILVRVMAGSRDELTGGFPRGSMHYLEHALSYGSTADHASPRELIEARDNGGKFRSEYNLNVGLAAIECTIKVPARDTAYSLGIAGKMLSDPNYHLYHIAVEKDPIQIERQRGERDFESRENYLAIHTAFGRHPFYHPTIGTKQGIDDVTVDVIKNLHAQNIRAGRVLVVVEGPVQHDAIVKAVGKNFVLQPGIRPQTDIPTYTGGDDRYPSNVESTRIVVGFKTPSAADLRSAAAFDVAFQLLTARNHRGSHSLFDPLRDKGLVYEVHLSGGAMVGTDSADGVFTVAYDTLQEAEYAKRSLEKIRDVIAGLAERVDQGSFDRVMAQQKKWHEENGKAKTYGPRNMANDIMVHEMVKPVDFYSGFRVQVTPDDVRQVARQMLESPPTFLAAGDIRALPSPEQVREIFYRPSASTMVMAPRLPGMDNLQEQMRAVM